jgi:hypothetical protein
MSVIRFKTKLFKIDPWTILRFPEEVSAKLPSRGQTMIKGAINGFDFHTVLEPNRQKHVNDGSKQRFRS